MSSLLHSDIGRIDHLPTSFAQKVFIVYYVNQSLSLFRHWNPAQYSSKSNLLKSELYLSYYLARSQENNQDGCCCSCCCNWRTLWNGEREGCRWSCSCSGESVAVVGVAAAPIQMMVILIWSHLTWLFLFQPQNTGSARAFMTSCSNSFVQASALTLSPIAIALQNIMYNAKSLVQFRLLAIWLASSDNNKVLLRPPTLLSLLSGCIVGYYRFRSSIAKSRLYI